MGFAIRLGRREKFASTARGWLLFLFIGLLGYFHMTVGLVRASESLEKVHHSLTNYIYVITTPEALFLVLTFFLSFQRFL